MLGFRDTIYNTLGTGKSRTPGLEDRGSENHGSKDSDSCMCCTAAVMAE